MVRLIKALYGHPESGAHWEKHFEEVLRDNFNATPVEAHPSTYWLLYQKLMLTVYVDDLLLAGPKEAHPPFWDRFSKLVDIEEVTPLGRFLGRSHSLVRSPEGGVVHYDMSDYANQAVEMYSKRTGVTKFKSAPTPFCADGSLTEAGDEEQGEMAPHACAVVMKFLWLARLARPDLMKAITLLASRVQKWTRNDDKRLYRLTCYLKSSANFKLKAHIGDPPGELSLKLFVDADFAGDTSDARST
jgi:hypothetical protein